MRIAILSDIHGNRQALESIINDIKNNNIDEIICLGDTIGMGPCPSECLDLIINNNIQMVLGNHELYYLSGTDIDDEMSEMEIDHQNWSRKQITKEQREFLNKCELTIEKEINGKKILFEHFPLYTNSKKTYPFHDLSIVSDGRINKMIDSLDYDLIFIGHEHKNFIVDNRLFDVGSSGCRLDNITRYTIFDTDTFKVETKEIPFDREGFIKDITSVDYPCRKYLALNFFGVEI